MAVASLVVGIIGAPGCCYGVLSILALVFGYSARRQIDASRGRQSGRGLATAGIVVGWVGIALTVVVLGLAFSGTLPMGPVPLR